MGKAQDEMERETLLVNDEQRQFYEDFECKSAEDLLRNYLDLIDFEKLEHDISILDVGGASGFFSKALLEYLEGKGFHVSIWVIDTSEYSTWSNDNHGIFGEINFVKGSVENIEDIFSDHQFDLIFCNRVIHHLVTGKSYNLQYM